MLMQNVRVMQQQNKNVIQVCAFQWMVPSVQNSMKPFQVREYTQTHTLHTLSAKVEIHIFFCCVFHECRKKMSSSNARVMGVVCCVLQDMDFSRMVERLLKLAVSVVTEHHKMQISNV